jgi:hypothetical protein
VQGIAECWFAFITEKRASGDTKQNRNALVLEWLRHYNSLTSLERNLVKKIELRGGVERVDATTRAKLALWLDDMLGHDERWRPNTHDRDHEVGDSSQKDEGDNDEDTRLIDGLLALMWPLRVRL